MVLEHPEERMHRFFSRLDPAAKKHEVRVLPINIQAFFEKPVSINGKLDLEGMISAINKIRVKPWQLWKREKSLGSALNPGLHLERILKPLEEYISQNPKAVDEEFKKDLKTAMRILEGVEGDSLISVGVGTGVSENGQYAVHCHELIHQYIQDFGGRTVSTGTLEGSRTHEGLASYLELTTSGVYDNKRFADAVKQFMGKRHRETYGEPAKLYHEMLSKSDTISEDIVDKEKLEWVLRRISEGKTLDEIYEEHTAGKEQPHVLPEPVEA